MPRRSQSLCKSEATHKSATPQHARASQHVRLSTRKLQASFLEHYAAIGVITAAARAIGIDRGRHYEWMREKEKYPDYESRFEDAYEQANDRLETEMVRRGVQGWDEPVFQNGKKVGAIRRYSDRLLEIALKARRPDRFHDRREISGPKGGPIEVAPSLPAWMQKLTDEELDLLRGLAERAAKR